MKQAVMWRVVKEDTVLGGVALKAGEPLLLRYGSANRDAATMVWRPPLEQPPK